MSKERNGIVIERLQEMIAAGLLHIPEPSVDANGNVQVPWSEETDGDVLACYMNILGLNEHDERTFHPSPLR